jgi:hypothetical protein
MLPNCTSLAFNLEWEIRRYYDPLIPPNYSRERKKRSLARKPGESLPLKLLLRSDSQANSSRPWL